VAQKSHKKINFKFNKSKIPLIFGWLVLAALLLIFFTKLPQIIEVLRQIKWPWLVLAVLAQLATYGSIAVMFKIYLSRAGHKIKYPRLYKLAFATDYINKLVPSWGIAGIFFLTRSLNKDKVRPDQTITLGSLNTAMNLTVVFSLIIISLVHLILERELTHIQALAALLSILGIIMGLVVIIYFTYNKSRFKKFLNIFLKPIDKVANFFQSKDSSDSVINDLHKMLKVDYLVDAIPKEFKHLFQERVTLIKMFVAVTCFYLADIITIYFLFAGFNYQVRLSILFTGFVFTLIFAYISLIPADVGIFETSMTLVFAGLGVPFSVALLTALAFRFLAYWLTIPFGYFVFREITTSKK
jgi:uncharacterized protein (TIRG00374 family)